MMKQLSVIHWKSIATRAELLQVKEWCWERHCYCCWDAAAAAWRPPCWRDCMVSGCARHCTVECCSTGKPGPWLGLHMATSYESTPGAWLLAAELPLGEEEEGNRGRVRADQRNPAAIQVKLEKIYLFLSLTLFELDWPLQLYPTMLFSTQCPSWENALLSLGTVITNTKKTWVSSEAVPFSEFEKTKAITISLNYFGQWVGNNSREVTITCLSFCLHTILFVRIMVTISFTLCNALTLRLAMFWFDCSLLHCLGKQQKQSEGKALQL